MKRTQKLSLILVLLLSLVTFSSCSAASFDQIKDAFKKTREAQSYKAYGTMEVTVPGSLLAMSAGVTNELPDMDMQFQFDKTVGKTEKGELTNVTNYEMNLMDLILRFSTYGVQSKDSDSFDNFYVELPQFLGLALGTNAEYLDLNSEDPMMSMITKSLNHNSSSYSSILTDEVIDSLGKLAEDLEIKECFSDEGSTSIEIDGKKSYGRKLVFKLDKETLSKVSQKAMEDESVLDAIKPLFSNGSSEALIDLYKELGIFEEDMDLTAMVIPALQAMIGENGYTLEFIISSNGILSEKYNFDYNFMGISIPCNYEIKYSYSNKNIKVELPDFKNKIGIDSLIGNFSEQLEMLANQGNMDMYTDNNADTDEFSYLDYYQEDMESLLAENITLDAKPSDYFYQKDDTRKHVYTVEADGVSQPYSIEPTFFGGDMIQATIVQGDFSYGILYRSNENEVAAHYTIMGEDYATDQTSKEPIVGVHPMLKGPLTLGSSWVSADETQTTYIFSVDSIVETPIGEFETIGVRTFLNDNPEIYVDSYYAKGIGMVYNEQSPVAGISEGFIFTTLSELAE